jgi:transcriptional regulator with XRE-family HTH domain
MPDAPAKTGRRALPVRLRTNAIDRHVGVRLREQRVMLGLTQQQTAELLGVTYQQVHKYEKGINRISGGHLHRMAGALGVGVDYFFEGIGQAGEVSGPTPGQRRLLGLAWDFVALPGPQQEALCRLARALAEPAAERPS